MPPDSFPQNPPAVTDFASLIREISQLLGPDLDNRIRNDLTPPRDSPITVDQGPVFSAHDAILEAMNDLENAQRNLDALRAYFDAAAQYAAGKLAFHASFKAYVERTTNQVALRSELLSPIRRLPNEVYQLIFIELHVQLTKKERQNPPVTAQVCTFWRELALATPFLWTSINVSLKGEEGDVMAAVAFMETRVERAKQQLVAVRFSMKPTPTILERMSLQRQECMTGSKEPRTALPFVAAVTALLKHRDRLGSLHIPPHDTTFGQNLATRCAAEDVVFKNLHALSFDDMYHRSSKIDAKPLLKACPNIQRLRIHEAPDTPFIHWEKLNEFRGSLDTGTLSAFVSRARNIKQAEISTSWATLPTITFSDHLVALSLGCLDEESARKLSAVALPSALRYLSIRSSYEPAAILLEHWGHVLEFLAIDIDTTVKDTKGLLQFTPNLEGFRICVNRDLAPNHFSTLRKLTHLELQGSFHRLTQHSTRILLSRVFKSPSRGKRLLLQSVAFLPNTNLDSERFSTREWDPLYQDLKAVGVEVHEYRTLETLDTSCFNTAFFKERGWCI